MTRVGKQYKRVTWRVARCDIGWKPVVLVGEAPMSLPIVDTKREARRIARAHAAEVDFASKQH